MMKKRFNARGVALFVAIALLFLLSAGVVVVLLTAYNYANVSENQIKRLRAMQLAEAGLNYAYWKLRTDEENFILEAAPPDGTDPPIYPDPDGPGVVITVTFESGRYKIQSKVTY